MAWRGGGLGDRAGGDGGREPGAARCSVSGGGGGREPLSCFFYIYSVQIVAKCHIALGKVLFFMFFKNVRRVSLSPTANSLSSARELAHGKEALCRPLVAVSILPCVTHGKVFAVSEPAFAVCQRHTTNGQSPVVKYFL